MNHFPIGDRNGGRILKKVISLVNKLTKKTPPASKSKGAR